MTVLCATAFVLPVIAVGAGSDTPTARRDPCGVVVLQNFFTFRYTRTETSGSNTRVWLCTDSGSGYVDIPSTDIERFELPPPPAAVAPPPPLSETARGRQVERLRKEDMSALIASTAGRHGIDPDFLASVVKAESASDATAVSPKGAMGLMQLMPKTAASLGVEHVFDAADNLEAGTRYLRQLLDRYAGDPIKALAAYNAGVKNVDRYGGIPPFAETFAYVTRIIRDYNLKKAQDAAVTYAAPIAQE